jgi:nucleoside-diphosphate-sugar epimerase
MKLLVVGGSGFLSGTLVRDAVAAGHDVWAVTRGNKPLPAGARAVVADRTDRGAFARAIQDAGQRWDLVVDCIGFTADDARQDLECFAGRADQLVFISTDFVLDPVDRPWMVDETYDRFDAVGPYGRQKREAEVVLLDAARGAAGKTLVITVLRPCHIYGPGSQLGCLPLHGRDPQLIDRLRRRETLKLVGGGHFLQQPVLAADLARMAMSCHGNARAAGQLYLAPGPDICASWEYYRMIADVLGVPLSVEEVPIEAFLAKHPERHSFSCHRVYTSDKAKAHGLAVPATPLREGLRRHVESMLA